MSPRVTGQVSKRVPDHRLVRDHRDIEAHISVNADHLIALPHRIQQVHDRMTIDLCGCSKTNEKSLLDVHVVEAEREERRLWIEPKIVNQDSTNKMIKDERNVVGMCEVLEVLKPKRRHYPVLNARRVQFFPHKRC